MLAVASLAWLAHIPKSLTVLGVVIGAENFAIGLGAAAFSSFVASITNKKYSATQYALLTSFMALSSTLLSSPSGYLAEAMGWTAYFTFCALLGIPGLILLSQIDFKYQKSKHLI